jgi:DNA gyrase/topoisomerase IV subunit B
MTMYAKLPVKLIDIVSPEPHLDTELLVVEGDSASSAVAAARDLAFQAVIPMQGKPLNAWKASRNSVAKNEFFAALIHAIGADWGDAFAIEQCRYRRVVLLFDPDADGIHCGALTLMFFYRWMRPLLDAGRIFLVHPPMFEIVTDRLAEPILVMTEEQALSEASRLEREGHAGVRKKRFRGLGGMGRSILSRFCLDPATRRLVRLSARDALAAIEVFSPNFRTQPVRKP